MVDPLRSRLPFDLRLPIPQHWWFFVESAFGDHLWMRGVYMLMHPLLGVVSLTLLLAIFFVIEGLVEIVLYFNIRGAANAGWVLFDGIVTLILGYLIWRRWPSSSVWVIGTLVGISLIFSGISRFMLSSAARRVLPTTA